jgi:chromosome segregation ATPase
MSYDVSQWLAEIRTLQRQLADTQKERDQAYASAANWRRLYETEARQRRNEVEALRSQLQALETQLQAQKSSVPTSQPAAADLPVTSADGSPETRLEEALTLCQSLAQQLKAEKEAHEQTRQTLTTALGDTFDMLKLEQPASTIVKAGQADDF